MPRSLEAEETRGDILRNDEIFNQQNKTYPMEETFKEIGILRLQLETANRTADWDSAEKICGNLQHQYRLLVLNQIQKERSE